jgi:hypothetical protein
MEISVAAGILGLRQTDDQPAAASPSRRDLERRREQADLPTQQPPPEQDPRVPHQDADAGRPPPAGAPPGEGARQDLGLSRASS